ncbi:WecB/TagA/CpsF family glycosyltransferase, partial [bacterium]|nr:WecB/TagA/CpsF family glycosyltransferase [bacterium]
MNLPTKKFFGLNLVDADWATWCKQVRQIVTGENKRCQIVLTPNPEQMMLASRDPKFYQDLQAADVLLPDGHGLVWASGCRARLTGSDTVVELLRLSRREKLRLLLIGGRYESHNGTLAVNIEGEQSVFFYTPGYQSVQSIQQSEQKALELLIAELKPVIVCVALGAPAQERWLTENRELLQNNGVRLAMAVGGAFDFVLGRVARAPRVW